MSRTRTTFPDGDPIGPLLEEDRAGARRFLLAVALLVFLCLVITW